MLNSTNLVKAGLILSTVMLAACVTNPEESRLETRYEPEVVFSRFMHPLPAADQEGQIASTKTFLRAFDARYGDTLILRGGSPEDRSELGLALTRTFPGLSIKTAQGSDGAPASLMLERVIAVAPTCGDWSRKSTDTNGQGSAPSLGCTTSAALAQMVANPRDLLGGQAGGPVDSEIYSDVIQAVREERFEIVVTGNSTTGSDN